MAGSAYINYNSKDLLIAASDYASNRLMLESQQKDIMIFNINSEIEEYCKNHSEQEEELLKNLSLETTANLPEYRMLCGSLVGNALRMLASISQAKNILELGTYTGYSALHMVSAIPPEGQLITCEINKDSANFAEKYFNKSSHGHKIKLINDYANNLLDEYISNKNTSRPMFDMIFVDADKTNYPVYYEKSLQLLHSGGLIVFDNALWGGEVLEPLNPEAQAIDRLNSTIINDNRVTNVLLYIRDGINIVRKI